MDIFLLLTWPYLTCRNLPGFYNSSVRYNTVIWRSSLNLWAVHWDHRLWYINIWDQTFVNWWYVLCKGLTIIWLSSLFAGYLEYMLWCQFNKFLNAVIRFKLKVTVIVSEIQSDSMEKFWIMALCIHDFSKKITVHNESFL